MDRETKVVDLPSGSKLELKTYLIGREKRALQNSFLGAGVNVTLEGDAGMMATADLMNKAQDIAFRTVVVSIDGKKDGEGFDIVSAILDMKGEDFDAVVKAVNEVTNPEKKS